MDFQKLLGVEPQTPELRKNKACFQIDEKTYNRLAKASEYYGLSRSCIIRRAINYFLDTAKKEAYDE